MHINMPGYWVESPHPSLPSSTWKLDTTFFLFVMYVLYNNYKHDFQVTIHLSELDNVCIL